MTSSPPTVLVVDAYPDNRDMLALALSLRGYSVQGAESPESALAILELGEPDAMIFEIYLPGMQPHDFVAAARRIAPNLCMILMTTLNGPAERAKALGVHHAVGKPIDLDALFQALERCREERRSA